MDFSLSEEQKALVKDVDEFCKELEVNSGKVSLLERPGPESEKLEDDLEKKIVEKGWYGLPFPAEYGGQNKGAFELGLLLQAFHRGGLPYPGRMSISIFCGLNVLHYGTEQQKRQILPKLMRGELTLTISITEPDAGSDVKAMKCKSVPKDEGFYITGQKVYSSGAAGKDNIICVVTRTHAKKPLRDCMTLLLVPANTKGIVFRRLESMGRRMGGLYEVFFDNVWVPKENVLGKVNEGWNALTGNFSVERAVASAAHLGFCERIFNDILETAKTRVCRNRVLGDYQSVGQRVAEFAAELQAARILVYSAFCSIDQGKQSLEEVSMCKLFCSELQKRLGDAAMELAGGYGYLKDSMTQWYYRESRIATIGAGSSQMMRNAMGIALGLRAS